MRKHSQISVHVPGNVFDMLLARVSELAAGSWRRDHAAEKETGAISGGGVSYVFYVRTNGPQTDVDKMVAEFRKRRTAIVDGLNKIPGVSCKLPAGAFYAFPNITKTGLKSKALATGLLEEAGVACLSGTDFGQFGEGYLRFSYANSLDNINEALKRFEGYIRSKS